MRGESPRVEDYLHTFPELRTAQECLITLICAEWTVRSRHGESPTLAEISLRFGPLHLAVLRRLGLDAPPTPAVQAASSLADDPYRTAPPTSPGQPFPAAFGLPTQIGPYRIVREIGRGGMGVVYEAEDLEGKSRVALKTLPLDRQGSLLRFKNEFRSLQNVINEHLVRMLSLDTSTVQPFFTMELIEGTTFLHYVRGGFDSQRPEAAVEFDERRLRHAMQQLASAVQALHDAGKLHRDIKPSNVMVRRGDERVVLLDFGLAVSLSPSADYRTAQVAGTPRYMAPEQRMGQGSPASDWYSVGVMLHEALTGNVPGEAEPQAAPAALRRRAPPLPSRKIWPHRAPRCCGGAPPTVPAGPRSFAAWMRTGAIRRPADLGGTRPRARTIRAAAERVRGGEPFAQFIHGVSGIGKTALVERFLAELAAQPGVLVFRGRCFEGESVPYNAFDGAMDGMADYLARCKEGLVERLLPMDIADLCRMFPVFGEVGPCQRLLQGSKSGGTEQESRQRAVAALREMLGRMVRFGSALVVLFLDDVQRCDQDSAELFEGLMRLPQAPPVLVLAAFRRDDVAASRFLPGLLKVDQPAEQRRAFAEQAEIALEGLSAEEVAELAASHGQAARAGEITRESGGVPIFIDYLLEPGAAAPSAPSASEPFSLAVVLGQRIERLPPDQQRLLQIVAIGGRPVAESLALRAAGLGGSAVAAAPDLRRQRFLRTLAENEEPLIETYHDRLRDAVLRSLSAEEVRAGSAALAEALESGRGRDAEWLAELWARAGQKEKAGEYSYLAAERAQESMAFANAARLYQRGLEWAPRSGSKEAELRVRLADALAHAGRSREAAAEYLRAATLCEASQAADLRCRGALRYLTSGHLSEGLAALTGVLREAGLSYPAKRFTAIAALLYEQARLALRGLTPRTAIAGEIEPSGACT